MKPIWYIDEKAIIRWDTFVKQYINTPFVQDRIWHNVERQSLDISKGKIWEAFVVCQITSQQKSGRYSKVGIFLNSLNPILNYSKCVAQKNDINKFLQEEIAKAGLRFNNKIALNLTRIFEELESNEWIILSEKLESIKYNNASIYDERKVSDYLRAGYKETKKYPGIGPKQSRNFIQYLGLSRYEIPLDSRVLKKLKEFECTLIPVSSSLADEAIYCFIENGLQEVAKALDIYPCVLDACIFSSFD